MFLLRIRTASLVFFICGVPTAYCTSEALGLKIDESRLVAPKDSDTPTGAKQVCEYLTNIEYQSWSSEIQEISYKLWSESSSAGSPGELEVDTDEEEGAPGNINLIGNEKVDHTLPKATKDVSRTLGPINRSRHIGNNARQSEEYVPTRNYVKNEIDDSFARQLSTDAHSLLDLLPSDQSKTRTTYLCAALRDKHGYIKKFVFHNGEGLMPPAVRGKAHTLGYDIIQAEQSHAEGEFIQFLLHCHQVRPAWYTHIMGIGCSRPICGECDHLFKLFFGDNYPNMSITSAHSEKMGMVLTEDNIQCCFSHRQSATSEALPHSFTPMYNKSLEIDVPGTVLNLEAIDTATYSNYYMPKSLQQAIQYLADRPIDFSNGRFTKPGQDKSSRRRRR